MKKQRIWELDVLRGLFILAMVAVHLIYNLQSFFGISVLADSKLYDFVANWGGALFFILSGICVTLGSNPVRRGLVVFACGLGISGVTAAAYALKLADRSFIIWFGVLHCLGLSMLLWPGVKKLPWWALLAVAVIWIPAGVLLNRMRFDTGMWLTFLGFMPPEFASSDYFPLLPFFGFFLMGGALGKTLYKNKKTLFPRISPENALIRAFGWVGRQSLAIYILHQPVMLGAMYALEAVL